MSKDSSYTNPCYSNPPALTNRHVCLLQPESMGNIGRGLLEEMTGENKIKIQRGRKKRGVLKKRKDQEVRTKKKEKEKEFSQSNPQGQNISLFFFFVFVCPFQTIRKQKKDPGG